MDINEIVSYTPRINIVSEEEMERMKRELWLRYIDAMRTHPILQHLSHQHQRELADNLANVELGIKSDIAYN